MGDKKLKSAVNALNVGGGDSKPSRSRKLSLENERDTEDILLREMKANLRENDFGYVYSQGITSISEINRLLTYSGGKPKNCDLLDFETRGSGKGKPEYIITLNDDINTIIVVECKANTKHHESQERNQPKGYSVDGVLYYSKYLKESYNVIALAVSGTNVNKMNVSAFYWRKGQEKFIELDKAKNIILEPNNYLKLVNGDKVAKSFDIQEIKNVAIEINEQLYSSQVDRSKKSLFISSMLIALNDEDFCKNYININSFSVLLVSVLGAIDRVLSNASIANSRIESIKNTFKEIEGTDIAKISLSLDGSLMWYLKLLELKIKPIMYYTGETVDALGIFYHEFLKYSGSDGKIGITLTPKHITEFMIGLLDIDENTKIIDICCGSGSFLVAAMGKMFKCVQNDLNASLSEKEERINYIRKNNLYGVELSTDMYQLALVNMILRGDGKSNIVNGNCFDEKSYDKFRDKDNNFILFDKAVLNPPYSLSNKKNSKSEFDFLEQALSKIKVGGECAVICPTSCAIGTKHKEIRKRLMEHHTLKAVFSMPNDLFYENDASVDTCIMLWEAHKPHDSKKKTFFGFYKDDGFVKKKKLGRIDSGKWNDIKKQWLDLYRYSEVEDGLSAMAGVTDSDEWLCEAYMRTDYSTLSEADFQRTLNNYLSYLVKEGIVYES